jgi:hypothetical protein
VRFLIQILIIIIMILPVAGWGYHYKWLIINQVECKFQTHDCPEEITSELNNLIGKPLFFTKVSDFLPLQTVDLIATSRQLPDKLLVTVNARQAGYFADIGDIVDIDPDLDLDKKEVAIQKILTQNKIPVTATEHSPNQSIIIVTLENDVRILLPLDKVSEKTTAVILILTNLDLASVDKQIVEIDVRYNLPVLRTSYSDI